jgi:hypothetical protein
VRDPFLAFSPSCGLLQGTTSLYRMPCELDTCYMAPILSWLVVEWWPAHACLCHRCSSFLTHILLSSHCCPSATHKVQSFHPCPRWGSRESRLRLHQADTIQGNRRTASFSVLCQERDRTYFLYAGSHFKLYFI